MHLTTIETLGLTRRIVHYFAQSGGARHLFYMTPPQISYEFMLVYVIQIIGIPCTGLGKIAIGITILRIIGNTRGFKFWSTWFVMAITAITSVLDIFLTLFACGDPRILWDLARLPTAKCLDIDAIMKFNVFSAAFQTFSDFFFSILPVFIVWKLQMPTRRKAFIIGALGLTFLTGSAGLVKTVLVSQNNPNDPTWSLVDGLIWFSTEAALIIVCGSVPTLYYPLWEFYLKHRHQGYDMHDSNYGSSGLKISKLSDSKSSKARSQNRPLTTTFGGDTVSSSVELTRLTGYPNQPPVLISGTPADEEIQMGNGNDQDFIRVAREVKVVTEAQNTK